MYALASFAIGDRSTSAGHYEAHRAYLQASRHRGCSSHPPPRTRYGGALLLRVPEMRGGDARRGRDGDLLAGRVGQYELLAVNVRTAARISTAPENWGRHYFPLASQ